MIESRRFLKNLLSLGIGAVLALVLLEIMLRAFPSRITGFGSDVEYRPDPKIGATLVPGLRNAVYGRKCIYNNRIRTNSLGFRDDEWSSEDNRFRIAIIGDSFMEALQVPDGKLLADLLEKKLGGRADVQNYGISGFGTVNEYLAYICYARKFKPDLVLLFFSTNDVLDNCEKLVLKTGVSEIYIPAGYRDGDGCSIRMPRPRPARSGLKVWVKHFLKRNCKTLVALSNVMAIRRGARRKAGGIMPIGWYTYMPPKDGDWVEAWDLTACFLSRLADSVRSDGARFIVFTIPYYERICDDWREGVSKFIDGPIPPDFDPFYPNRRISGIAKDAGIELIELEPAFIEYRRETGISGDSFYFSCDGHFNETGHEVAADAVFKAIDPIVP